MSKISTGPKITFIIRGPACLKIIYSILINFKPANSSGYSGIRRDVPDAIHTISTERCGHVLYPKHYPLSKLFIYVEGVV